MFWTPKRQHIPLDMSNAFIKARLIIDGRDTDFVVMGHVKTSRDFLSTVFGVQSKFRAPFLKPEYDIKFGERMQRHQLVTFRGEDDKGRILRFTVDSAGKDAITIVDLELAVPSVALNHYLERGNPMAAGDSIDKTDSNSVRHPFTCDACDYNQVSGLVWAMEDVMARENLAFPTFNVIQSYLESGDLTNPSPKVQASIKAATDTLFQHIEKTFRARGRDFLTEQKYPKQLKGMSDAQLQSELDKWVTAAVNYRSSDAVASHEIRMAEIVM